MRKGYFNLHRLHYDMYEFVWYYKYLMYILNGLLPIKYFPTYQRNGPWGLIPLELRGDIRARTIQSSSRRTLWSHLIHKSHLYSCLLGGQIMHNLHRHSFNRPLRR